MNKTLQKCAEILVECGYAIAYNHHAGGSSITLGDLSKEYPADSIENADPFSDTLEGRRQADAIEDWLLMDKEWLWEDAEGEVGTTKYDTHQWRLDRIKWCIEELIKMNKTDSRADLYEVIFIETQKMACGEEADMNVIIDICEQHFSPSRNGVLDEAIEAAESIDYSEVETYVGDSSHGRMQTLIIKAIEAKKVKTDE